MKHPRLPRIGMRIIKSAVATFLCLLVDQWRHGTPFYSALAVLQCMQNSREGTLKMALQRTTGTLVGAAFGLVVLLLQLRVLGPLGVKGLWWDLLISITVAVVLYATVLLHKKNASYFSCVVFLSIVINHIGDANPYLFVLNRVTDTLIGVAIGMAVNAAKLPRRVDQTVLYASALDDVLVGRTDTFTDFSKVALNRMLDEGIQFTIMTMRTPASFLEVARDIRLKLPVILMNGAVLYDIPNNRYLKTFEIPYDEAVEVENFLAEQGAHCFTNIIQENSVLILYQTLGNEGEQKVYQSLRKSPYRNYIRRGLHDGENVVYFLVVDATERVETLYKALEQNGYCDRYRVIRYEADQYEGYSYLKIFHRDADKQRMLRELQTMLGAERTCTIGSVPGQYDLVVDGQHPGDEVVRQLRRLCLPVVWRKKKEQCEKAGVNG